MFRVLLTFVLSWSCPDFSGFNDFVLGGLFFCYILISIFLSLFSCYRDICSIFRYMYSVEAPSAQGSNAAIFLFFLSIYHQIPKKRVHESSMFILIFSLFFSFIIYLCRPIQHGENKKAEIVGWFNIICLSFFVCLSFT